MVLQRQRAQALVAALAAASVGLIISVWHKRLYNNAILMEKPNVRGPSPSRKAHLALREKLNRPDKPPPLLRTPINSPGRKRHR
jgi:hypothetical protein